MNWNNTIKAKVGNVKYPVLTRIKIGRVLGFIAALPLFTSWMFLIATPMMMAISPTIWLRGRVNTFKGNGDLKYG